MLLTVASSREASIFTLFGGQGTNEDFDKFQNVQPDIVSSSTSGSFRGRRLLYRQSSMDFIKPTPADIKDNASIARSVLFSQNLVLPFIPSTAFRIVSNALTAFSPTRAITLTHTPEPHEPTTELHDLFTQLMFRPH